MPTCELVDIGLIKLVERLTGERLGDAQFHATQGIERPFAALQVTLDQLEAPRQGGQRVKGHVHDLVAGVRDDTGRKGADALKELEIARGIIDEHKGLLFSGCGIF